MDDPKKVLCKFLDDGMSLLFQNMTHFDWTSYPSHDMDARFREPKLRPWEIGNWAATLGERYMDVQGDIYDCL